MHACFPEHLRIGTARLKYVKETEEEGKKYSGYEKNPVVVWSLLLFGLLYLLIEMFNTLRINVGYSRTS